MAIFAAMAGSAASAVIGGMMSDSSGGSQGQQNMQQSSALDQQQAQIAHDQYDHYKSTFQPLEDQMASQSQGIGSEANQNKAAQTAAAGVAASYAGARQRLNQMPGGLSQQERTKNELALDLGEAASSAGAQTAARDNVVRQGRAALQDAVSLGKGIPATSMTGLNGAATGLATTGQQMFNNGQTAASNFGKSFGAGGMGDAVSSWIKNNNSTPNYRPGDSGYNGAPGALNVGGIDD